MQEKNCLWCDRVFEMKEERIYRFCDSCFLNMGHFERSLKRKYPIQCLEEILLKAEDLKMEDNKSE